MLLTDNEVNGRIESPLNLMNRLRLASHSSKSDTQRHPSLPPSSNEIIEDLEDKIKYGSIRSKAKNIMISAMDELATRLPEVQKPERLAAIAAEMGKVISSTQIKVDESSRNAQIIIYAPQIQTEEHFETIIVNEET
jgi:hypothetical protein